MFKQLYHHLDEHVETYLATIALAVFTTLIVFQVFMRYVLNSPSSWAEEIAAYALAWFVYFSGSYAIRYQRHVRFNVLVDTMGRHWPIVQRLIRVIVFVAWLAFLVIMAVYAIEMVMQQHARGQTAPSSRIPFYLVYLGLPIGLLLMSFRVVQHTVAAVTDLMRNPNAPILHESQDPGIQRVDDAPSKHSTQ